LALANIDTPCLDDKVLLLHLKIPHYPYKSERAVAFDDFYYKLVRGGGREIMVRRAKRKNLAFQTMLVLLEDSLFSKPFSIHLMSYHLYGAHIVMFFPLVKILTC